jgi:hypothetical protein
VEILTPLKEKLISIPNFTMNNDIKHFFSAFFIQSILFLVSTPFALSVPAFLFLHSFSIEASFAAIMVFSLALIVFLSWLFVSVLFIYSVTDPKTLPRYVALSWIILSLGTFITWVVFFQKLNIA